MPETLQPDIQLHNTEALSFMRSMPTGCIDAVICDPPYSSGGMVRSDRTNPTSTKYSSNGSAMATASFNFSGDNRDQRGFLAWCSMWMSEALRCTKPGGMLATFTDWRQLPVMTDAIQAGGWVWRGIIPWVKPNARPQLGRFTNQCEYVLWASAGALPTYHKGQARTYRGAIEGIRPPATRVRIHPTEKPVAVMEHLMAPIPSGGIIFDPFMGSGSTAIAAINTGHRFIGCEMNENYFSKATTRISQAANQHTLDAGNA